MRAAVDETVSHAKDVALGELDTAGGARKAGQVVDQVTRAHYQLVGGDAGATAGASLHAEQPMTTRYPSVKL